MRYETGNELKVREPLARIHWLWLIMTSQNTSTHNRLGLSVIIKDTGVPNAHHAYRNAELQSAAHLRIATSIGTLKLRWFKTQTFYRRGVVLVNKPGLYEMTMPDDDQHTLKLVRVRSADVGEIVFVASNKYGSDACTFTVEMAGECNHPNFHPILCPGGVYGEREYVH